MAYETIFTFGGVGKSETKPLDAIMKGLVNSESEHHYNDCKGALLQTLGNGKANHLYKRFMQHWDTTTDEWVMS
ncbi:hypothetical protein GQ600_4160 [Phytophthora cactorum]|nr:hypothetical protein GQ600_4160 [Phytophthora cactorum]